MKNIHLLSTDKPSRLFIDIDDNKLKITIPIGGEHMMNQNIYITSDEEIKGGDWILELKDNSVWTIQIQPNTNLSKYRKIILTTDQNLIKDGVQSIDDEFLEWFVKNPSCEEVEVKKEYITPLGDFVETCYDDERLNYKIIIPKEEPNQETLEEAAEETSKQHYVDQSDYWAVGVDSFKRGAKWQQERMYSEEEVLVILDKFLTAMIKGEKTGLLEKWFEQFKKK